MQVEALFGEEEGSAVRQKVDFQTIPLGPGQRVASIAGDGIRIIKAGIYSFSFFVVLLCIYEHGHARDRLALPQIQAEWA